MFRQFLGREDQKLNIYGIANGDSRRASVELSVLTKFRPGISTCAARQPGRAKQNRAEKLSILYRGHPHPVAIVMGFVLTGWANERAKSAVKLSERLVAAFISDLAPYATVK